MKTVFLIAKARAFAHKMQVITRADVQTALNNVRITDTEMLPVIYNAFDVHYALPEARYTEAMLADIDKKPAIKVQRSLQHVFDELKTKYADRDIMNISRLNRLGELEKSYLEYAENYCDSLNICNLEIDSWVGCEYVYDAKEAIDELGLSEEVIDELLNDYVDQILRSNMEFIKLLALIWEKKFLGETFDMQPFRDLVHKNLGVARNLRIKDAIAILSKIRKEESLHKIALYLDALVSCAIKLKPKQAVQSALAATVELSGMTPK